MYRCTVHICDENASQQICPPIKLLFECFSDSKVFSARKLKNFLTPFRFFSVAILLSLYYLFLWDPYIKGMKTAPALKSQQLFILDNNTYFNQGTFPWLSKHFLQLLKRLNFGYS
jgi:hypothetical protein